MTAIPAFRDRESRLRDCYSRYRGSYYHWRDRDSGPYNLLKSTCFRDRYSRLLDEKRRYSQSFYV